MVMSVIAKLNQILRAWGEERLELVAKFQEEIWDDSEHYGRAESDLLNDLALDMDYYEPNPGWRMEDRSFYGDGRLNEIISSAISELESLHPAKVRTIKEE